jgi:hypothetical protein
MQISVQIVVQTEVDEQASVTEIAHFERESFDAGSLGLHLEEAKALLGRLQRSMIDAQAAEAIARLSMCPNCGSRLTVKGHHRLVYRSVFGLLSFDSPRFRHCSGLKAWAGNSPRMAVPRKPGCWPNWRSSSVTSRTTSVLS